MTKGFNEDMKYMMTFNTPATPHKIIVHNKETNTKNSYEIHKRYRIGVGPLIYLVKNSQP